MDYVLPGEREKESQLGFVVLVVLDRGHTFNEITPETAGEVAPLARSGCQAAMQALDELGV